MNEAARAYFRRHRKAIYIALLVVGLALMTIFVPRSRQRGAMVGLIVVFAMFYSWAETNLPRVGPKGPGQAPTIGDHLKQTRTRFVRVMMPLVFLWIAGVVVYGTELAPGPRQALAIAGAVVLFWIPWLLVRDHLRCPRCGTDFRQERHAKLGRWAMDPRGTEELWDSCPHCGVSFSDAWP